jgi:hypothetical protein
MRIVQTYDKSCIYCILNADAGKLYFGQTRCFNKRAKEHIATLKRGNHCNVHLQRTFNDGQNLVIFPVEECEVDVLNVREMFWISYHQATDRELGYNMSSGGDFSVNTLSPEALQRKAEARKGKPGSLKGRTQSKEWVEGRAKATRGQKREYSKEHLRIISETMRARKGQVKPGISIEIHVDNKVLHYDSIRRAAEYMGIKETLLAQKFYKGRAKRLVSEVEIGNAKIIRKDVV